MRNVQVHSHADTHTSDHQVKLRPMQKEIVLFCCCLYPPHCNQQVSRSSIVIGQGKEERA